MAVIESHAEGRYDPENAYRANVLYAKAEDVLTPTEPVQFTNAGEVVPRNTKSLHPDTPRTVRVPNLAHLEASEERTRLLDAAGTGVLSMGLALAEETEAEEGIQKMICHQMSLMHVNIFQLMGDSKKQSDPIEQVRLKNCAIRMMTTFQQAALTLQRLKSGGEQRVVVKHLHMEQGAQAVIGNVTTRGVPGSRHKKGEMPCVD